MASPPPPTMNARNIAENTTYKNQRTRGNLARHILLSFHKIHSYIFYFVLIPTYYTCISVCLIGTHALLLYYALVSDSFYSANRKEREKRS